MIGRRRTSPATARCSARSTRAHRTSCSARTSSVSSTAISTSTRHSPAATGSARTTSLPRNDQTEPGRPLHTGVGVRDARGDGRGAPALRRGMGGEPPSPPPARRRVHARFPRHPPLHRRQRAHSRLLSLLLLYKGGDEVGRFVSLEKLIEQSKETYYDRSATPPPAGTREPTTFNRGSRTSSASSPPPTASSSARRGSYRGTRLEGRAREGVRPLERYDSFTFAEVKRAAPGVSEVHRQVLRELRDGGVLRSPRGARRPVASLGQILIWRRQRGLKPPSPVRDFPKYFPTADKSPANQPVSTSSTSWGSLVRAQ